MRIHYRFMVIALLASCGWPQSADAPPAGGLQDMLSEYLSTEAESHWEERAKAVAAIRTPAQVAERQAYAQSRILDSFGGFPEERAPLQARITGALEPDGYRVEKLIYESLPELYVTANVYVPLNSKPPFPAVLITAGHGWSGKASSATQQLAASLAQRGILALAYDPIGQGERLEYFDPDQGRSRAGRGSTGEHMMADWKCRLTGGNFARYKFGTDSARWIICWSGATSIRRVDTAFESSTEFPLRFSRMCMDRG